MYLQNVVTGLLMAGLLQAQEPARSPEPTPQEQDDLTFRQQNLFIMAPVIVRDLKGHIVNGLTPLDFELDDNGKPQAITEDAASHPVSMVVAVQSSANMAKMLAGIRKIGVLFSGLVLGESGEIAVLSFDHRVQTMTEFTSDPDKISDAFKNLKAGGSPNHLNDAAMQGVNMLRRRDKSRRRVLLLIGETRDNGSEMGVRDVLTEAEFRDIAVYTVEVSHFLSSLRYHPDPPRPSPIPPEARTLPAGVIATLTTDAQGVVCCSASMGDWSPFFKELFTAGKAIFIPNPQEVYTKFTGGHGYSYKTQRGLEEAITNIGDEIHSQYLLTYLPNNPEDSGYHEIEVRILKPGLRVSTRPGYWSAARPR